MGSLSWCPGWATFSLRRYGYIACARATPVEKEGLRRETSERGLSLSKHLLIKLLGWKQQSLSPLFFCQSP